ncbi:MAG: hypothetical protein ABGW49_06350 [Nitrosopumilus sp.]|jgi:hypothetical protein|nr:hypothetical protein [Nitrosopumilus sp.]
MLKIISSVFLILLLIPFSQVFSAEFIDNPSTLSVSFSNNTPFVYLDSDGYTVVVGIVENNNSLTSIDNVRIQASFFDDFNSDPLEVVVGNSTLDVIPPDGKSPYVIRSQTPNPNITQAYVSPKIIFDSSSGKETEFVVYSSEVSWDTLFRFSGVLQNGDSQNSNTNIYLAFYDEFEPPRILSVSTIELGDVESNAEVIFDIDEKINVNSKGFLMFAESNIFNSNVVDVTLPSTQSLTKLVTISDVVVKDSLGNNLSEIELGSIVNIESKTWIQFAVDQSTNETPYTYYVQIKESGKLPYVEYIGKYDGQFIGTGLQSQTIEWIPKNSGLFFIETFVWDRDNVPISEKGQFVLIYVK